MLLNKTEKGWKAEFSDSELARWRRLLRGFGGLTKMDKPAGWWLSASSEELWRCFVGEFLVRGGIRLIERKQKESGWKEGFDAAISLETLVRAKSPVSQLRIALKGATRFWQSAAGSIASCLRNKEVVRGSQFVLLSGLEEIRDEVQRRDKILSCCPRLGLKGASNFLINVGAATDLAAIDTRLLSCLREHFGAPREAERARSCRNCYLAVEGALREAARSNGVQLAFLDRTVFQASGVTALRFLLGS